MCQYARHVHVTSLNLWRVYLEFLWKPKSQLTVVLGLFHLQLKLSKSEEQQLHSVNIPVSFFSWACILDHLLSSLLWSSSERNNPDLLLLYLNSDAAWKLVASSRWHVGALVVFPQTLLSLLVTDLGLFHVHVHHRCLNQTKTYKSASWQPETHTQTSFPKQCASS